MSYRKGVNYEREVLHYFNSKGFVCVRAASSGSPTSPFDILALKAGKVLAIECKNWSEKPKLTKVRASQMVVWCERAGAIGLLAWRAGPGVWRFLTLNSAEKGEYGDDSWLSLEDVKTVFGID